MVANRLSCFCDGCLGGLVCSEREGTRPSDVLLHLREIHTATGDFHGAYPTINQGGWEVLKKAQVGDMVGIYVPQANRCGTHEKDGDLWASRKYIIGQLAESPEPGRNVGTRRRPTDHAKVKLFLPEQVGQEEEGGRRYVYPSPEVCDKGLVPVESCRCGKKHYTSVPVGLIRGGPWRLQDMVVDEWDGEDGEEVEEEGGGRSKRARNEVRASNALLRVYMIRRGALDDDPHREQKILLPLGAYQFLSQLDQTYLQRFSTTLNT